MFKGFSYAAALLSLAFVTHTAQAAPGCSTIAIAPGITIPAATAGTSYGPQPFTASGSGATPYAYDISSGLPAGSGLTLNSASGQLSGTPAQAGSFLMTITATDTNGCSGGRTYALDVAVGDQTISFTSTAPAAATVGGATYTATATATSGLAVTFSIDATATSVCSIAGSTVSFLTVGTCVIDANQAGNASFNAAPQVQQSFAVGKGNQTITFTSVPPANPAIGGPTYNVTATGGGSGSAVTFTIDATASSVCAIAGSTVSFTGTGTCVIDANQAGDANYNAASQAQQSFGVNKTAQTITFTSSAPGSATVGGATYNVTATATSGLTVAFTIDATATSVCSIAGATVSFVGVGSCVIDANQAGDTTYAAAPQVQQSFAVGKGSQTITFTSVPPGGASVGGATYSVTATATSGLAVTFTIDATASSFCSITGNTVSFIGVGTCVIDANQAGDANYNAAPQVQQSFAVAKGNQTISFTSTAPAGATVGGPTYNVTATATSGLTVALTIDATSASVCTIAGSTVSFIGVGTCQIDANQAGDANYNAAAQALQSFAVGKGNQTITFTSVPPGSPLVGGPTYNVTATSNSGLTVTFTIDATAASVCSISGSTVSFIGQGTCVIDADQAGDANWNAAPQAQQSFGVNKQNQTISFTSTAPAAAVVGGPTYDVTATATSGLTVTFTIDATASSICSIAGSTVSFIGAGTCVIDANQAGDTTYNAALQVQQSFAVGKGNQTITYTSTAPVGATVGGPTYSVTATATSGLAVTFTIDATSASVCSIAGSTVSFIGAGTCVIDANQAGDANWNAAAQAQQSFAVGPGSQTISFTSNPGSPIVGGPTYTVSATASSGLTVTFTIDATATSICSIAGSTVSFIGAGTCVIDANQAGNANYNAAPLAQQSFAVGKGIQTILFTSVPPAAKVGGPTYDVTATGGPSGNPVVFTIDASATSICSISGNTVSFTAVGTCVIDADQAGNANYNAAITAQQSFGVAIGDQTITFTSSAPAATVGGATYDVTATATSGLTVTFSIDASATSICSINTVTNTVSFIAVGTCVIDADQAGDANWNPAPQAQQSFTVNQGSQTISFTSTAPVGAKVSGPTYTVTATATSGLAVTFTIDATATSVCSIAGSTVSFLTVGTCKIDANQAGNANYTAAPQAQQSFAVAKGDQTISFTSTAPANAQVGGPTYTVTATASSGLTVTFTIDATATSICSIAGSTVSFTTGGTCVIDANQAGNANYNAAPQVQQSFTVSQPPAITSASNTTFAPGKAGQSFTVTTTGFPTPGITVGSAFATGVTFTDNANGTATIAGTPAAGTQAASPYVRTITANNGVNPNATQNFTLNITCPAISVSGANALSAIDGTAMSASLYTQVGGNGAIGWSASPLPAGVSISGGTISGTPTATGTFSTTVTATDAGGCQGTKSVTFTSAPSAVGDTYGAAANIVDNTQAVVTGGTTVSPATPFVSLSGTLIVNDLPAGGVAATPGTFSTTGGGSVTIATDGTFIYTPHANASGAANTSDSFAYTVTSDTAGTGTPATSAPATVNLTLAGRVWYVNNSGGAGNGQSQSPFNTLAAAGAASTANDILFVYNGNGTNSGQNAGITLKNGQQLLGEANGLTVNTVALVAAGSRPTIGNGAGDGISVPATAGSVTGVFIKGLAVAGSANGVNISSSGANTLTATVDNVIVNNATANNGIKVAAASTTTSTVTVQNSTISAANQNGIDAQQTVAGNLVLNINNDAVTATGTGININGAGSTSTTITNFANNAIGGNTGGSGITVTSAIFDAIPGGAFQTVSGGTTSVGVPGNGVGASGMVLTNVSGDLSFTDLDIVSSGGGGLVASSSAAFNSGTGAGFQIAVGAGVATVDATGGPAVSLSTVTANLPWSSIKSTNSTTTGVSLVTVPGTFTAGVGSSISNATGVDFSVNGSNATVTYGGTITDTTGQLVNITGTTGGTKSFSGAISDTGSGTGQGISLTTNTGATVNFSGTLTLSTGANPAFTATGGGTVTTADANSTILTTTGTAINVANTTIGASGLKFKSVSAGTVASGPASGIILNTTGASGGLTVTGTGSAGSGGTIQKMTGAGISMTSTKNVSLSFMNVQNGPMEGILGTSVDGFTLINSSVTGNSTAGNNRDGIKLTDTVNAVTFTSDTVTGNFNSNVQLTTGAASTAVMTTLTVTGGTYSNSTQNVGFLVDLHGSAALNTASVSGATFSGNFSKGIQFQQNDTATMGNSIGAPATGTITVNNNTFTNNDVAASFESGGNSNGGNSYYRFTNNATITGSHSLAVNFANGSTVGTGTFKVFCDSNHIGTAGVPNSGSAIGEGIRGFFQGNQTVTATITNNVIRALYNGAGGFDARGIDIEELGSSNANQGQTHLDVKLTGNDVDQQYTGANFNVQYAIYVASDGQGTGTSGSNVNAEIHGNTVPTQSACDDSPCDGTNDSMIWYETVNATGTRIAALYNAFGDATVNAAIISRNTGTAGKTIATQNVPAVTLTATPPNTVN